MCVLPIASHLDQPHVDQQPQVMRHRRLGDGELGTQVLAGGFVIAGDPLEDGEPSRVGEGLRYLEKVVGRERHRRLRLE